MKSPNADILAFDRRTAVVRTQANFSADYQGVSGTTQSTNAAGNKLYTKYTLNTGALPTGITFGSSSLVLNYNASGSYALTAGNGSIVTE